MNSLTIRKFEASDGDYVWAIMQPILEDGETYALPRDWRRGDALAYWTSDDRATFVAEVDGKVLGTYYLKANQLGGGGHVCNCGYMTASEARGKGIAQRMCLHSQEEAISRRFTAMQFNFVVSTNKGAIRLWESLGFQTVGRLPDAFRSPRHHYVDAFVMHKALVS